MLRHQQKPSDGSAIEFLQPSEVHCIDVCLTEDDCTMELECLPNELLHDIFDYLDDVELLRIFFNLNARFTELLSNFSRTYRLNFQFVARKQMDVICGEPFSTMVSHIVALRLSDDDDTPRQTKQFSTTYPFRFHDLCRLERLSLHHVRCEVGLLAILTSFVLLPNLAYLSIDQIHINIDEIFDFSQPIWAVPTLTYLYISNASLGQDRFISELVTSSSLKHVHLMEHRFSIGEILYVLEYTPHLEDFSATIDQNIISTQLALDEYPRNARPLISVLTTKFIGCLDGLEYLFELMPNLRLLKIETEHLKIDGYQWQEMICDRLSQLEIFQLKMAFNLNGGDDEDIEIEVDELLESYQTSYWSFERQMCFRCHWIPGYVECDQHFPAFFYSLPFVFDTVTYTHSMFSKSTCAEETECESYDSVHTLRLLPNVTNPNVPDFQARFRHVRFLITGYRLEHLGIFPSVLAQLATLQIQSLHGQVRTQLQALLNRAPRLQTIVFYKNNWSLFFVASNSVRRVLIRDGVYYNIQQCAQLCTSALFQQCEVLDINLRTASIVIDLIKKMPQLHTLLFQCERDEWFKNDALSEKNDELLKWFKRYLPSEYSIQRESSGSFRLWIS